MSSIDRFLAFFLVWCGSELSLAPTSFLVMIRLDGVPTQRAPPSIWPSRVFYFLFPVLCLLTQMQTETVAEEQFTTSHQRLHLQNESAPELPCKIL